MISTSYRPDRTMHDWYRTLRDEQQQAICRHDEELAQSETPGFLRCRWCGRVRGEGRKPDGS